MKAKYEFIQQAIEATENKKKEKDKVGEDQELEERSIGEIKRQKLAVEISDHC